MSSRLRVPGLYYITHIDNLCSILEKGILSHQAIINEDVAFTAIYDEEIVTNRSHIQTPNGKNLWDYANVFFQARNPMLYRVLIEKSENDIAIVRVQSTILNDNNIFITTGNAAHSLSEILPPQKGRKILKKILKNTDKTWWRPDDGSKREIMAECLVPNRIPQSNITGIYVASVEIADRVRSIVDQYSTPVIPEPWMFFKPGVQSVLSPYLSLVLGDMFFSRMQTLTISVNTMGIMGKGLASRAKYQFPAIYVAYQDMCRSKKLRMGKPVVYTTEDSLDHQLADEPQYLVNGLKETKFLLFATKDHWRYRANIDGIEEGLQWLQKNHVKEGIESLAIPSLGCGLGRLDWKDVGPLLCRYLSALMIPVQIYLPAEEKISAELLTRDYLLG